MKLDAKCGGSANPEEEPQQVPVLPLPEMPGTGHVAQW